MFNKDKFIDRLCLLMKNSNVTKAMLSKNINVSHQAVSQFCSGDSLPSIERLVLIAEYFDVSVDYLLGLTENPKRN